MSLLEHFTVADPAKFYELVVKLGISAVLGGAIGWERERRGHPTGVRTLMLVMVGCTLMTEVSMRFGDPSPSRVAAQIVTGIGFLGAGAIMRRGAEVKGLTSAASIWVAAAIGMAVGIGGDLYAGAVAATVLTIVTLSFVDVITGRVFGHRESIELTVTLAPGADASAVFGAISNAGVGVARFTRNDSPGGVVQFYVTLDTPSKDTAERAVLALGSLPEVRQVEQEPT
jgi:putative Mg2+ transporter-C (MgtC) family protein